MVKLPLHKENKGLKNRLIVALDTDDGEDIDWLSGTLMDIVPWVKIGFQAFNVLGTESFLWLSGRGHLIFLDLKFHDIPNTSSARCWDDDKTRCKHDQHACIRWL